MQKSPKSFERIADAISTTEVRNISINISISFDNDGSSSSFNNDNDNINDGISFSFSFNNDNINDGISFCSERERKLSLCFFIFTPSRLLCLMKV